MPPRLRGTEQQHRLPQMTHVRLLPQTGRLSKLLLPLRLSIRSSSPTTEAKETKSVCDQVRLFLCLCKSVYAISISNSYSYSIKLRR